MFDEIYYDLHGEGEAPIAREWRSFSSCWTVRLVSSCPRLGRTSSSNRAPADYFAYLTAVAVESRVAQGSSPFGQPQAGHFGS